MKFRLLPVVAALGLVATVSCDSQNWSNTKNFYAPHGSAHDGKDHGGKEGGDGGKKAAASEKGAPEAEGEEAKGGRKVIP